MRYLILLITLFTFLLSETVERKFKIDGMTCGGCANKVMNAVNSLDGVNSCDVNVDKGQATIIFDSDKINDEVILTNLIDKTDFSCSIPKTRTKKGFFSRLFGW